MKTLKRSSSGGAIPVPAAIAVCAGVCSYCIYSRIAAAIFSEV